MSERSKLDGNGARPEEAEARRLVRLLQSRGGTDLFTYLVLAAADGRWNVFTAAFSELSDISEEGVGVLLETPGPSLGWAHIYKTAGLPQSLFRFFIRFVVVARQAAPPSDIQGRAAILAIARASQEAKDSPVPDALWEQGLQN